MSRRLETIEEHPALKMTPGKYGQAVAALGAQAMSEGVRKPDRATQEVDREAQNLSRIGAAACLAGFLLWPLAVFPLADALPSSWDVPERFAAPVMGEDRWNGGSSQQQ